MRVCITFVLAALGCGSSPSALDATVDGRSLVPISTPANTWTWVEIPGSYCASGSTFGFGVNRSTVGPDLFVYFQGGGACWDAQSCFIQPSSVHLQDNYNAQLFAMEIGSPTVNHNDPANPLAAATFIYIPYCTGDLHSGARTATYDVNGTPRSIMHVGATNTQLFVDTLRAAFPGAQKIWLSGSSAGGYGATFNHHRFVAAWSTAEVHTLQDGSPFMQPTLWSTWQQQWALQFPPSCPSCEASMPAVMDALGATYPTSRFGLLTYDDDAVIKAFFGFAATPGSMVAASNMLLDNQYDLSNTKAFMLAGTGHTMLGNAATLQSPSGVKLSDWMVQWATGATAWATVRP
jgi:hypothetical protein